MTESVPKVSVCVGTYNQEGYIRQCLQSIIDQKTDYEFELIVGDDCSTDRTRHIVQEFAELYPNIIRTVMHDRNVGSTQNYLSMHNLASGEYVCHCDGDDYWAPQKIDIQTRLMEARPDVVQSWHRQYIVNSSSGIVGIFPKRFSSVIFGKELTIRHLAHSYSLVGQHSSHMYRRQAKTIRHRDRTTIDYFFALDIANSGKSMHIPDFLGYYRVVPGGSMTQNASGRDAVDICMVEAAAFFSEKYPELKPMFRANLSSRAYGAMWRRRKNWRQLFGAVKQFPFSIRSYMYSLFVLAFEKL